jgi:hypothetical protein
VLTGLLVVGALTSAALVRPAPAQAPSVPAQEEGGAVPFEEAA